MTDNQERGSDPSAVQATTHQETTPPQGERSRQLASRIHRVVAIIAAVVSIIGFAARHRLFGKGIGQFALSADECRSGKLLQSQGGRLPIGGICTRDCSDNGECGASLRCHNSNCVPNGTAKLGERCDAPWDCQELVCLKLEQPTFAQLRDPSALPEIKTTCSRSCTAAEPCPDGFTCGNVNSDQVCIPDELSSPLQQLLDGLTNAGE